MGCLQVELLKTAAFRPVVLKLLYHFSTDERCKSIFVCTDCIPLVLQMLVGYPDTVNSGSKELLGLAVNLATNSRNAEMMCGGEGLHMLFKRLFKTMDPILMKVIRNSAQHDGTFKCHFKEYVQDLVILAKQTANPDLLVEVLGTLGNLTEKEVNCHCHCHWHCHCHCTATACTLHATAHCHCHCLCLLHCHWHCHCCCHCHCLCSDCTAVGTVLPLALHCRWHCRCVRFSLGADGVM